VAYEIVITRPCTDAPGRFIAESSFGRRFAMGRLCALAKAIDGAKGFSDLKCSESLGVAKFDYRGRTLILYKSGRIDLRRIVDADDALAVMHDIEERLKDAFEQ
jgi:ArsR family metal-binding transcriptional regulator